MSARARWLALGAYVGLAYGTLPYGPAIGRAVTRNALGAWLLGSGMGLVVALGAATLLAALARRAGLAPVREAHLSLEHSPVTLTQTWINRALGGDNRLFRSLTYDDDPDAPRGRVPLPIHFAAAAACLPFAVLVSLWLARRGTGDTYGAYFRRLAPPVTM